MKTELFSTHSPLAEVDIIIVHKVITTELEKELR